MKKYFKHHGCYEHRECKADCYRKKFVNKPDWFGDYRHGEPDKLRECKHFIPIFDEKNVNQTVLF
jgi:hypothetical protein